MYLLSIYWFVSLLAIVIGFVSVSLPAWTPLFLADLYIFGKARALKAYKLKDSFLHVPKSWFRHMYLTGVIVNTGVLTVAVCTYFGSGKWPIIFRNIMAFLGHPDSGVTGLMEPLPVLLALFMEEVQVIRRFLETMFINVYSDSKMSWVIYLVGIVFYATIGLSIMSMASEEKVTIDGLCSSLKWYHILSVALFIYASWKQYKVNVIIAKLRKDKGGRVENRKHHIPIGDLFEYCSCPHFFMEILIYTAIASVFFFQHQVCVLLWVFVTANQLVEGHMCHKWYKETFPKYPKTRTATIPYLFGTNIIDNEPDRIRMITWNIDGLDKDTIEERTTAVQDIIDKMNPHVVFLQEVTSKSLKSLEQHFPEYHVLPGGELEYFTCMLLHKKHVKVLEHHKIKFPKSIMKRNLLIVNCLVKGMKFELVTTHLESTKTWTEERLRQLKQAFSYIKNVPGDRTVVFGGDLNLEDDSELTSVGGLPSELLDLWEVTGSKPGNSVTWDMSVNDNRTKTFSQLCLMKKRIDRLYISHPTKGAAPNVEPHDMKLIGQERIRESGPFPSDHWGILTHFKILNKSKVVEGKSKAQ